MKVFFKWRTSLSIRKWFRFQVCKSPKSTDTTENNQSQTGSSSSAPMLGSAEQISESLQVTPQEAQLGHRTASYQDAVVTWENSWAMARLSSGTTRAKFHSSLSCHAHHLWLEAHIPWAFTVQLTTSNSLTQMLATVWPQHYGLTLRKPPTLDSVNLLIAPWQVLVFLVFFRNGDMVYSGFTQHRASGSP